MSRSMLGRLLIVAAMALAGSGPVQAAQQFNFERYSNTGYIPPHIPLAVDGGDRIRSLTGDFRAGGTYVMNTLNLQAAVPASEPDAHLRFKLRAPIGNKISIRLVDTTGQNLQYTLADRSAAHVDDQGWSTHVIKLADNPTTHWNAPPGALNAGKLLGSISAIALVMDKDASKPLGTAYIRNIQLLPSAPSPAGPVISSKVLNFQPGSFYGASGATGSVLEAQARNGDDVHPLPYSFAQGADAYVLLHAAPNGFTTSAHYVRFRMRADPALKIAVRVLDSDIAEEKHEYKLNRDFSKPDDQGWETHTLRLGPNPISITGGGAEPNKRIDGPIKKLSLIVSNNKGDAKSGVAHFKEIELLDHAPSPFEPLIPVPLLATNMAQALPAEPNLITDFEVIDEPTTSGDRVRSIKYDFSRPGTHVGMSMNISSATPAPAGSVLRFLARIPKGVNLAMRYTDTAGTVFQSEHPRPLQTSDDTEWVQYAVKLGPARKVSSGTNVVQEGVVRIALVLQPLGKHGAAGLSPVGVAAFKTFTIDQEKQSLHLSPRTSTLPGSRARGTALDALTGVAVRVMADTAAAQIEEIELARAMGFRRVRFDLTWASVETASGFSFNGFNAGLMNALAPPAGKQPLEAVVILGYNHPRYSNQADDKIGLNDVTRARFVDYARVAAQHIKDLTPTADTKVIFEVWNEPNHPLFWKPAPDSLQYATLLDKVRSVVADVSPNFRVVSGGLASVPHTSQMDFRYLDPVLTAAQATHGIGLHPYEMDQPELQAGEVLGYADYLRAKGIKTPLWQTEVGVTSIRFTDIPADGPTIHASMGVRNILTAWSIDTPMHIVYRLRDVPSSAGIAEEELHFGLLTLTGVEKPAGRAVRQLLKAARGRTYEGLVTGSPSQIQAMKLSASDKETVYVVWSDTVGTSRWPSQNQVSYTVTARKACNPSLGFDGNATSTPSGCVVNMVGEPLTCQSSSAGWMSCPVSESAGPIYIRMAR